MFPVSNIVKNFACGKTKCSYFVTYGLAPYFKSLLNDTFSSLDCFVAMFDESYNKTSFLKRVQMDLHVHFWDIDNDCVATRYFNSTILGKAAAQDIYENFNECISELDENKLLQVYSDGPNINLAFLNLLNKHRFNNELPHLINIGTRGLHTIHNSMKHGENSSGWKLNKLLQSMYKIFEEAPKRREKYEEITLAKTSDYPLQFCLHRWVENEIVAKRAIEIWPRMVEIVRFWKGLSKSNQPGKGVPGANTSFDHLKKAIDDPLIPVKLFQEIASKLNSF